MAKTRCRRNYRRNADGTVTIGGITYSKSSLIGSDDLFDTVTMLYYRRDDSSEYRFIPNTPTVGCVSYNKIYSNFEPSYTVEEISGNKVKMDGDWWSPNSSGDVQATKTVSYISG